MIRAIAVAVLAWDALLHLTTLAVGRFEDGSPVVVLPWFLFPTFPSWQVYDLTWGALHIVAVLALLFPHATRKGE